VSRRTVGWACLAGFIACIFLANYAIQNWGVELFPGGPHMVTLLGLTAPSGVLFVGLSFSLRDGAQMALGKWHVLAAVVLGAGLSYLVAPSLAWASAAAFLASEFGDWAVYTPLVERGKTTLAIALSNTVGSLIDTLLFLWIAFGTLAGAWDLFWLKLLMVIPALLIVVPIRVRRAVAS
jgi:uncharacterized PurR-regulated membrane protein YhhQ (DUF165 family)